MASTSRARPTGDTPAPDAGTQRAAGPDADTLIVGAGLSGLTLTLALAEAGLSSVIVDRVDPRAAVAGRADIRTTAISLSSRRLFTVLGAWQAVADGTGPIHDIRVSDAGSSRYLHYDHSAVGDEPMGHIVDNGALKASLLARLVEHSDLVTFAEPGSAAALDVTAGRATLTLEDGRVLSAPLVVAADGRGSRVRALAGIRHTTVDYHQTAVVDTIAHAESHHNLAHERFLPGGPLALLPLQGNRSALVWTERTAVAERIAQLDDASFAAALEERFGDSLGRMTPVGPRRVYPLTLTLAESGIAERVALVGDAFHALHPIAGQGFNVGVRDIAVLAEVLADASRLGLDIGGAPVLRDYQRRRRFDIMTMVASTDGLTRLFSNDIAPVRSARRIGLSIVERVPAFKRAAIRHAMGTLGTLPRLLRGEPV
ncbi:UbiH/UbiF/VisC/COQ6 family ubiquinone biosynthesis hydroxylase [Thalassobaculum sp. OXR-137]|uniref:UbiH/UbiF/VisC/COQ6 family ubiquinone biosynthesis hydroxylase n=1 Tax=Thalassobaculum sp. OXR-137 TaxID=3100173 RepID=UPI002AC8E9FE|nr:UbiH/UbiF/VisC/COQ6 family ubiquinone biosynthesis hydroxylase [Thalassobaculum sp. OXR-137]WPZ35378.1 UbiH/UbiF/VisC/COQ6 family ubiquinone biosynthesis hydroxylase [Thalassobaculum sp. OXR-137]